MRIGIELGLVAAFVTMIVQAQPMLPHFAGTVVAEEGSRTAKASSTPSPVLLSPSRTRSIELALLSGIHPEHDASLPSPAPPSSPSLPSSPSASGPHPTSGGMPWDKIASARAKERQLLINQYAAKGGWMTMRERKELLRAIASSQNSKGPSAASMPSIPPALAHLYDVEGRALTKHEVAERAGYSPQLISRPPKKLSSSQKTSKAISFRPALAGDKAYDELTRSAQYMRRARQSRLLAGAPPMTREDARLQVHNRQQEAKSWLTSHGIPHDTDPAAFHRHPDPHATEEEQLAHFMKTAKSLAYLQGERQAASIKDYGDASEYTRLTWMKRMRMAQARSGASSTNEAPELNAVPYKRLSSSLASHSEPPNSGSSEGELKPLPRWANHPKRPRTQMEIVE